MQELVEEWAVPGVVGIVGERERAAAQQLDAVAGGDVGDVAALGGLPASILGDWSRPLLAVLLVSGRYGAGGHQH